MKEGICLAKSTNEQARIEDESSENNNSEASEIDDVNDDIRNIFYLIKKLLKVYTCAYEHIACTFYVCWHWKSFSFYT